MISFERKIKFTTNLKETLPLYTNILRGKQKCTYQLSKEIYVKEPFDSSTPLEKLWEFHKSSMIKFHSIQDKTINNEIQEDQNTNTNKKQQTLLDLKCEIGDRILRNCILCENRCEKDRKTKKGKCKVGVSPRISSIFLHHGEEPELVPSLTIFFSGYISQNSLNGQIMDPIELANTIQKYFKRCGKRGMRNMNWVGGDPIPNLPFILHVLQNIKENIPCVWNSNMYHSEEASQLLDGVVDLYLSDLKYGSDKCGKMLSKRRNYCSVIHRNLLQAQKSGADILIRHLVLPTHINCCTKECARWVAHNLGISTRYNLMFQYRPCYKASQIEDINRKLTLEERKKALKVTQESGLINFVEW
ncbi:pyruvate formate-lyase activating enzyme [Anaeramoeba flamelloides]|uniref:Pyruvate formate-lyase activating enzyme n=1 Tax=Anaeramoeba flamelloides TaxID=1746091 RepID=A0AAV7YFX9_9EUKA|nr:pyruvate formate-lyase activating enzyme [Anaeramoeba flamelloides]